MKFKFALILALFTSLCAAEEAEDPAVAVLKRMREQLRTVMIQQQKTEADRAALAAEKIDLEEKNKAIEAKFKQLAKESNAAKTDADDKIAKLTTKVADQEASITKIQEALAAWKKGHAEVVAAAKKIDEQRAEYGARVILLDRKVADANRKNFELFNIGREILEKYEGFGFGTALAAREPFTKNMRVKLESMIQDYGDKLTDNRVAPDDAPKKTAAKPESKPDTKPVSKEDAARVQKPNPQ